MPLVLSAQPVGAVSLLWPSGGQIQCTDLWRGDFSFPPLWPVYASGGFLNQGMRGRSSSTLIAARLL